MMKERFGSITQRDKTGDVTNTETGTNVTETNGALEQFMKLSAHEQAEFVMQKARNYKSKTFSDGPKGFFIAFGLEASYSRTAHSMSIKADEHSAMNTLHATPNILKAFHKDTMLHILQILGDERTGVSPELLVQYTFNLCTAVAGEMHQATPALSDQEELSGDESRDFEIELIKHYRHQILNNPIFLGFLKQYGIPFAKRTDGMFFEGEIGLGDSKAFFTEKEVREAIKKFKGPGVIGRMFGSKSAIAQESIGELEDKT